MSSDPGDSASGCGDPLGAFLAGVRGEGGGASSVCAARCCCCCCCCCCPGVDRQGIFSQVRNVSASAVLYFGLERLGGTHVITSSGWSCVGRCTRHESRAGRPTICAVVGIESLRIDLDATHRNTASLDGMRATVERVRCDRMRCPRRPFPSRDIPGTVGDAR